MNQKKHKPYTYNLLSLLKALVNMKLEYDFTIKQISFLNNTIKQLHLSFLLLVFLGRDNNKLNGVHFSFLHFLFIKKLFAYE